MDEWEHYLNEGYERSNHLLNEFRKKFDELHERKGDRFLIDDHEVSLIDKVNEGILDALVELQSESTLTELEYLVIWIPDSSHAITAKSVEVLTQMMSLRTG